jgi:hypothetical protein
MLWLASLPRMSWTFLRYDPPPWYLVCVLVISDVLVCSLMVRQSLSPQSLFCHRPVIIRSLSQSRLWVSRSATPRTTFKSTSSTTTNQYALSLLPCLSRRPFLYIPRWPLLYQPHTTITDLSDSLTLPYLALRSPASSPVAVSLKRVNTANLEKSSAAVVYPASGALNGQLSVFTGGKGCVALRRRGTKGERHLYSRFRPLLRRLVSVTLSCRFSYVECLGFHN